MSSGTLGTFVLPSGLVLADDGQTLDVRQTIRQTLDGAPVVFTGRALRKIALIGGADHGWLSASQLSTLLAMAVAGNDCILDYTAAPRPVHARVIFDHSAGQAVTWQALYPDAPYVIPTIRLLILEEL